MNKCKDCTFCCEGNLFKMVRLTKEQVELFHPKNIWYDKGINFLWIKDGCEFLGNKGCLIEENKPEGCKTYWCNKEVYNKLHFACLK